MTTTDLPRRRGAALGSAAATLLLFASTASLPQPVDNDTGRDLRRRQIVGDRLSVEERNQLARWTEARRLRSLDARAAYTAEHPPRDSTGMQPLTELGAASYQGFVGGLYPGGRNTPPEPHMAAGRDRAADVVPRDAEGRPDPEGRIGLLAVGMSNTTMEFQALRQLAAASVDVHPAVVLVDGAQGSRGAPHTANPDSDYWTVVDERLAAAGVTRAQVQVAWMKQVEANPREPFPDHARALQAQLAAAMNILAERFPNLRLAYHSSRVYAGYAEKGLHPEPFAYETGFAVKWLIEAQIDGAASLNHDPARGPVRAPWLAWGPYLWADGARPRADGLVYDRADFEFDGIHPSAAGRWKVGEQLFAFFATNPTTRPWFLTTAEVDEQRAHHLRNLRREGRQLTAAEDSLVEAWRQVRTRRKQAQQQGFLEAHPPRERTGQVPLNALGDGDYDGVRGGLYPGGQNQPPAAHAAEGLRRARAIVPLDPTGRPAADGRIVLLSVGMSNTTREFQSFMELAARTPGLNDRVLLVDGAQGGNSADLTAQPGGQYWRVVDERLRAAGATPQQVQVIWSKGAIRVPTLAFPAEALRLKMHLATTMRIAAERFPNLRIAYQSSRIYGGYAVTPLNPEPHAYEGGFAVKWLIEDQIDGAPSLNHDPGRGPVRAPWLAWGPYLWADGLNHRRDGLTWHRDELASDGTHPSPAGRRKVAALLLAFLQTDPTARPWFVAGP